MWYSLLLTVRTPAAQFSAWIEHSLDARELPRVLNKEPSMKGRVEKDLLRERSACENTQPEFETRNPRAEQMKRRIAAGSVREEGAAESARCGYAGRT